MEAISPKKIHVSSITVLEIEYGLKINPEREKKIRPLWENLLSLIQVVPYSGRCAVATSSIRANLKNIGLPIGPYDVLIAGTSLSHNMVMVTSNVGEFKRISEITIENWRDES
jgi:tRNA(fMet)-specific endonuclease VapC